MDDLSPDTRALLDRARHGEFLPAARRRTMRGRLAVALGVAAPLTLASALTASASVTTWMTRAAVLFGVAGAVGVGAASFLVSPTVSPSDRALGVETARAAGARGERLQHEAPGHVTAPEPARGLQVERTVSPRPKVPPAERETWRPSPDGAGPAAAPSASKSAPTARRDVGRDVETAPAVKTGAPLPSAPSEPPALTSTPLGAPTSALALDGALVTSTSPSPESPAGSRAALAEDALALEARLLADARRSVERGDARSALSLLDEHDRRFAAGALSPEGHAIRVDALCAAGRTAQARAEARAFRAQYPTSPLVRRFASTCAAADGGGPSAAPSR